MPPLRAPVKARIFWSIVWGESSKLGLSLYPYNLAAVLGLDLQRIGLIAPRIILNINSSPKIKERRLALWKSGGEIDATST
jgi:hypothetical protein